jgi:hypothetical protein
MSSQDVLELAKCLGAHATLKQSEASPGCDEVWIYHGPKERGGIRCWSDALFVRQEAGGWSIGFSQSGRTRVLQAAELRELLGAWISERDRAIFRPGTFAFLGFTHYWAKTLSGRWAIKRKTQNKRLSRFLSDMGDWCKEHLHEPLAEQHEKLCSKLRGHHEYYGVRGNYKMLEVAYEHTRVMWKKWLRRRNSKNQVGTGLALPLPRIVRPF